jgi:hypothetical protein
VDLARSLAETFEKLLDGGVSNRSVEERWRNLLKVPAGSPNLYFALTIQLQRMQELIAEIDAAPGINDRAKNLYRSAAERLIPFVHPAHVAGNNISALIQMKDSIDMLFLASDGLPDRLVPDIVPTTLDELCAELEALKTAAAEGDIPPDIKRLIQTSLDTLLMALRSYGLFGPEGVARIYGSVAAELARVAGDANTPKKAAGLLTRTIKTVKTVGVVVVWAGATVTGAHELLTHGPEVAAAVEQVAASVGDAAP